MLQAAAQEFALHGFEGANVNRIAQTAGFSIGTVYNYFPSKRALMEAFIDQTGGDHVIFILNAVKTQETSELRIKAFFQAGFDFVSQHLTPSRAIFNALNGPDQAFRLRLFTVYAPLFNLLQEEILAAGLEKDHFQLPDLQPPATLRMASLIMLLYLGVGSQVTPEGSHWISAQEAADFVLRALRPDNLRT